MRTEFFFTCDPPLGRLRVVGELDLASQDRLRDVLWCLRAQGCTQLEVDLAKVSFVDAGSLAVLDRERRRLLAVDGTLDVVAGSDFHDRVARLAGYYRLLVDEQPRGRRTTPRLTVLRGGGPDPDAPSEARR